MSKFWTIEEHREAFEEDAAILEYCAGMSRAEAEAESMYRRRMRREARKKADGQGAADKAVEGQLNA